MGNPTVSKVDSDKLQLEITRLIETTQKETLQKISQTGVLLYWHIGTRINSEMLALERAEYGKNIIDQLAKHLHAKFRSGFSRRIIYRCIQFAKTFSDEKIGRSRAVNDLFGSVLQGVSFQRLKVYCRLGR